MEPTVGLGPPSPDTRDLPQLSLGVVGSIALSDRTCYHGEVGT